MSKKAWYGALMGAGQGVASYGQALTTDALRNRADDRIIGRRESLAQLRQQFDVTMRDEKRVYDEARELEGLTPGTELYDLNETQRKKLADENQANAEALRKIPYGGGSNSGMMGNVNQSQWTQESFRAYMGEVNRLVGDEGLSVEEAQRVASATTPLVFKPGASSSDTASTNKIHNESAEAFMQQDKESMIYALQGWFIGEDLSLLTKQQLMDKYRELLERNVHPSTPAGMTGLMQPGAGTPAPAGNTADPLGLGG